jgi:N6-L-threonylcarbamoyladenine synthase
VKNGKVLANVRDMYTTEKGGIIPTESAKHHEKVKDALYIKAIAEAKISEYKIDAIAISAGPGLSPCLLVGMRFAKELSKKLNKPIVPVNHCVAHLEIGKITGAKDPVLLYTSGANTQIIAYASGKYRIFGETLDLGVGNFIDTFGRYAGLGFPAGQKIQELAKNGKNYIELPYKVKGMDIALSGILTNLKQKLEKINVNNKKLYSLNTNDLVGSASVSQHDATLKKVINVKQIDKYCSTDESLKKNCDNNLKSARKSDRVDFRASKSSEESEINNYNLADLCFSLQETVFAMLVETAERALAHTGKKELLLGGGVACNSRLQEMCKIMCEERGAKFFCPERQFLVDNAGMIAFLGEIMFKKGICEKNVERLDIKPRQRTDDVEVRWK